MRSSADCCWCSRFCAAAGARAPDRSTTAAARTMLCFISIRGYYKMAATVPGIRLFSSGGVEGELLAVADRPDAIGRDAERGEERLDGDGAALAEREVVLYRPRFVAMPFDGHHPAWVFLQQAGVLGGRGAAG